MGLSSFEPLCPTHFKLDRNGHLQMFLIHNEMVVFECITYLINYKSILLYRKFVFKSVLGQIMEFKT